jgi:hypothetical protein
MTFRTWLFLLAPLLAVLTAVWLGLGLDRTHGLFLFGAFASAALLAMALSARDRGWPLPVRLAMLTLTGPAFFLPFVLVAYDRGGSGISPILAAVGTAIPVAYFAVERMAAVAVLVLVLFGVVLLAGRRGAE